MKDLEEAEIELLNVTDPIPIVGGHSIRPITNHQIDRFIYYLIQQLDRVTAVDLVAQKHVLIVTIHFKTPILF